MNGRYNIAESDIYACVIIAQFFDFPFVRSIPVQFLGRYYWLQIFCCVHIVHDVIFFSLLRSSNVCESHNGMNENLTKKVDIPSYGSCGWL